MYYVAKNEEKEIRTMLDVPKCTQIDPAPTVAKSFGFYYRSPKSLPLYYVAKTGGGGGP